MNKKKIDCESILAAFTGKPESIEQLIKEGGEGITLTDAVDVEYKFLFYNAIGTGYYYKQDFKSAKENFE
ncbi:MAG: hypothetical protein ABIY51_10575, partial [Ferruginibacter sp.]